MPPSTEKLIPSSDLADFYAHKISFSLSLIYSYWGVLPHNKVVIIKINRELHEIYKQIKSRLERFDLKELTTKYESLKLNKLKPLVKIAIIEKGTGDRIIKIKPGKDYALYRKYVDDKECLIWECLDKLGLLGKVETQGRRLH